MDLTNIKFDEKGLVVAIAQDVLTGEVLMQAYMNREALEKTIESGLVTYFSRSRNRLWTKGEESGHFQRVQKISYDCDGDCILIQVVQEGAACHTGNRTCFYRNLQDMNYPDYRIVREIVRIIDDRKNNPVEGSYTNYLFAKGLDKVLKKIGEESSEVIIASKNDTKKEIIMEISDLLYHTLVLMNIKDITLADIYTELMVREGRAPEPKYLNKK